MSKTKSGFTLVELLIVIVIIAILAAITAVAYNGITARARDSSRLSGVTSIENALELYYIQNGQFPSCVGAGSTTINSSWCTTADASWNYLKNILVPTYISNLPTDPESTPNTNVQNGTGYNFAYFSGSYCGTTGFQTYILVYRLQANPQQNTTVGTCGSPALGYYGVGGTASNYRVVKQ